MPRRYPAPNYLPARYLGPIVIAERDPENERKKEEETEEADPNGTQSCGDTPRRQNHWRFSVETMVVCFHTCLLAMRTMEVRLNIDFSHMVGETKGEKQSGRKPPGGTCQFREMIPQPVSDRIVFNSRRQIYMETIKFRP